MFLFRRTLMKRIASLAALCLLAGFAFAADQSDNIFVNDFTTGMGKWVAAKCESSQDATGLKITKTEKLGGIGIDGGKKEDLSAYKTIDFDMINGGDKPIKFMFKIKSGNAARTDEKGPSLDPGAHTVSFKLAGGEVDLTKVDYIKIWVADAGDVNLTIKKSSLGGGAAASRS